MPLRLGRFLLGVFLLVAFCVLASGVEGQGVPPEALPTAQSCYGEAGWDRYECTVLFWRYHKQAERRGVPWFQQMLSYSAPLKGISSRSKRILAMPWGDVPGWPRRYNERWARLRAHVLELLAGEHPDPCPEALHFGGKMDPPRAGTVPATCAAQKRTANTLYRLKGEIDGD